MAGNQDPRLRLNSKEAFLNLLELLAAEWHIQRQKETQSPSDPDDQNTGDWENMELGPFLEAMIDWAADEDAETGKPNIPEEPSWQAFGEMLLAAKYYG